MTDAAPTFVCERCFRELAFEHLDVQTGIRRGICRECQKTSGAAAATYDVADPVTAKTSDKNSSAGATATPKPMSRPVTTPLFDESEESDAMSFIPQDQAGLIAVAALTGSAFFMLLFGRAGLMLSLTGAAFLGVAFLCMRYLVCLFKQR